MNDDIVIDFYGPSVIPYAGHYEGRAEARGFFETVLSSVDIEEATARSKSSAFLR